MKKILISIKPEWVAKILNGEKKVEIRKSMPKCNLPCEVYIYCTYDKGLKTILWQGGNYKYYCEDFSKNDVMPMPLNGKVLAKFTLFYCDTLIYDALNNKYHEFDSVNSTARVICKYSNLTQGQLYNYGHGNNLYAWHINNLIIFDEPKELTDFGLTKAPQSWKYYD